MYLPKMIVSENFDETVKNVLCKTGWKALETVRNTLNLWKTKQEQREFDDIQILHQRFHLEIERFKEALISDALYNNVMIPKDLAESILSHSSSVLRARYLVGLYECSTTSDWFEYFFMYWTMIEMGDEIREDLACIFSKYDMAEVMRLYADEESKEAWEELPETITVYRGCSESSADGFSWSLNLDVAKKFARRRHSLYCGDAFMKIRLYTSVVEQDDIDYFASLQPEPIYILQGQVKKEDLITFNLREESEIFSLKVLTTAQYEFRTENQILKFQLPLSDVA